MEKLLDYKKLERRLEGLNANLQESVLNEKERTELTAEIADVKELMEILENSSDYVKEYLQKKSTAKEPQQLLKTNPMTEPEPQEDSTDDALDDNQSGINTSSNAPLMAIIGIIISVFLVLAVVSVIAPTPSHSSLNETTIDDATYMDDSTAVLSEYDVESREEKIARIDAMLHTEINNFDDIRVFLSDIKSIKSAIYSETDEHKKKDWTAKLKAMQKKNFPKARKFWHQRMKQEMWSQDVEVTMSGTTVTFIGGLFAANANKQSAYNAVSSQLYELRFKKAKFMFTKYSEYTYWNIDSPADGDI